MGYRKIAAIVLALSVLSGEAFAENWMDVTRTPEGALISIDKDSGQVSGAQVKFWDRTMLSAAQLIGIYGGKPIKAENINGVTHYVEMRALRTIDCRQKTYDTTAIDYYDAKGVAVSRGLKESAPGPIAPGSLAAQEAKLMCPGS